MRRALTTVAVGAVVALALLAVPASADHGYQTYKFTNKTDKKVYDIHIKFNKDLSHIGDKKPTWPGAKCEIWDDPDFRYRLDCKSETRLAPGDSFKLSVATPPSGDGSYEKAKIKSWWWTDKDHERVGKAHDLCAGGCKDLGVTK